MNKFLLLGLTSILLIIISYFYIDRQLVWFLASHHSRSYFILKIFANHIDNTIVATVFIYYFYFAVKIAKNNITSHDKTLFFICNAISISIFLKDGLKIIFGRYWPDTFICQNPSWLVNHAYGYNWFTGGQTYASFPSGHSTLIFAFSTSIWLFYPKFRWLAALSVSLVVIGQLGMYYHFLSDLIAGALLGGLVAYFNHRYFNPVLSAPMIKNLQ